MTYSQINHAKAWGFSRKPFNLNHFGDGFDNLWATGYYCGSAGHVSQDAVRRYIEEQQGKDVFEYSIFGHPQTKIGDFSQC